MKSRALLILGLIVLPIIGVLVWMAGIRLATSGLVNSLSTDHISISMSVDYVNVVPGARGPAIDDLIKSLESDDPRIRWHAAYALGLAGAKATEISDRLIPLLNHKKDGVRWVAAYLLGELKAEVAVRALLEAMDAESAGNDLGEEAKRSGTTEYDSAKPNSVRAECADALGKIGPGAAAALPRLKVALQDNNPIVRVEAADAMWQIARNTDDTVPTLIAILEGSRNARIVGTRAAQLVGEMKATQAVPVLTQALQWGRTSFRDQAANALGRIGPNAKSAVPVLLEALDDQSEFFCIHVAEAMVRIDPKPLKPVWTMMNIIKDGGHTPFGRSLARNVLQQYGRDIPAVIAALLEAQLDADREFAASAKEALQRLSPDELQDPLAIMNRLQNHDEPHVRVTAANAMWKTNGNEQSTRVLIEALSCDQTLARRWAARALGDAGKSRAPEAIAALKGILSHEDTELRAYAAESIWVLDTKETDMIAVLASIVKTKSYDARARTRAAYALGRVGPLTNEAKSILTQAAGDQSEWNVFVAAKNALELQESSKETGASTVRSFYPPR